MTLTPETNCPHCGAVFATLERGTTFTCGSNRHPDSSISQSYLCRADEGKKNAQEEASRIRELLLRLCESVEENWDKGIADYFRNEAINPDKK